MLMQTQSAWCSILNHYGSHWEDPLKLTSRTPECPDWNCPDLYDYEPEPEMVAVRGPTLTDPEARGEIADMPGHEDVVLVPRDLILDWARQYLEASP